MDPGQGDGDHARARAKSRAVGAGAAVMERALAAPVFVPIAVRRPRTRWELPVLRCNVRSVVPQWYESRYFGLLPLTGLLKILKYCAAERAERNESIRLRKGRKR
jgi:hypothetical protein